MALRPGQHIASAATQPLGIFHRAQLGGRINCNIRIGSETEAAILGKILRGGKDTIAEIGFRYGTKSRRGTAPRQPLSFLCRQMRRMDETPARIDARIVE